MIAIKNALAARLSGEPVIEPVATVNVNVGDFIRWRRDLAREQSLRVSHGEVIGNALVLVHELEAGLQREADISGVVRILRTMFEAAAANEGARILQEQL